MRANNFMYAAPLPADRYDEGYYDALCEAYTIALDWASGSGVVPDKPALAPEPVIFAGHGGPSEHRPAHNRAYCLGCSCWCFPRTDADYPCRCCAVVLASVPAVTDDEAAREVIATNYNDIRHAATSVHHAADLLLALLRSAGFLLVRDHTKET